MKKKITKKEALRLATNFIRRVKNLGDTTCFAIPFGKDTLRVYHESLTHGMSIIAWVNGDRGDATVSWYAQFSTPAEFLDAIRVPLAEQGEEIHDFNNIRKICTCAVKEETATW